MRKKGFTLIELLAVIVILAIVALIATPIILGIISDAKENAFKSSIDGIVRSALTDTILNIKGEDILYKYNTNNWEVNKLDIDGQLPKYVEIKVNKEGKVRYAITDGVYCALKEYDSELNIKKISNENNDKIIKEQYCKLSTDETCFEFNDTKTRVIAYNCYERNDKGKPVITDIVIPEEIVQKKVEIIGTESFRAKGLKKVTIPSSVKYIYVGAFYYNQLTNVIIPNSVISIDREAFWDNQLTSITIPPSVTNIGNFAFYSNQLTSVTIPDSVTTIGSSAFSYNELTSVILPNSVTSIGSNAFANNKLTNITIPPSVTSIGTNAFNFGNQLTNVTIQGKSSTVEFTSYPTNSPFGWENESGCNDTKCITWEP